MEVKRTMRACSHLIRRMTLHYQRVLDEAASTAPLEDGDGWMDGEWGLREMENAASVTCARLRCVVTTDYSDSSRSRAHVHVSRILYWYKTPPWAADWT